MRPMRPSPSLPGVLWCSEGVVVTSQQLRAGRRVWPLGDIRSVEATTARPNLVLPLVLCALLAGVVLPVVLAYATEMPWVLAGAGLALFASILRLICAEETHCLVLRTSRGPHRAVRSRDAKAIRALAERLQVLLSEPPPRRPRG